MEIYLVEYKDDSGWFSTQFAQTEEEAHKLLSAYIKDNPHVKEIRYRRITT